MYELLEQGNRAEELTFSVAQGSPDERVVDQMVALGLLRLLTGNYEEQIVQDRKSVV